MSELAATLVIGLGTFLVLAVASLVADLLLDRQDKTSSK